MEDTTAFSGSYKWQNHPIQLLNFRDLKITHFYWECPNFHFFLLTCSKTGLAWWKVILDTTPFVHDGSRDRCVLKTPWPMTLTSCPENRFIEILTKQILLSLVNYCTESWNKKGVIYFTKLNKRKAIYLLITSPAHISVTSLYFTLTSKPVRSWWIYKRCLCYYSLPSLFVFPFFFFLNFSFG